MKIHFLNVTTAGIQRVTESIFQSSFGTYSMVTQTYQVRAASTVHMKHQKNENDTL